MHKNPRATNAVMHRTGASSFIALFDKASLVFGAIIIISFLPNLRYYPTELDTPYHLLMGKIISLNGPFFRWDNLEFAPIGRYMAYPPLLHWIIGSIHSIHRFGFFTIGRIIVSFQTILYIVGIWFFSRRYFGPPAAFAALVLGTSVSEFWWWQTSVVPIALAHAFFWLGILVFLEKKWIWVLVWIVTSWYLHLGIPHVILLSLLMFSIWESREDSTYIIKTAQLFIVSILLALPEFAYFSRGFLASFHATKQSSLAPALISHIDINFVTQSLNIWFWVAFILGAWHLIICHQTSQLGKAERMLISCVIVFIVMSILFYESTRFAAEFPLTGALLGGLGFKQVIKYVEKLKRLRITVAIALAIILCLAVSFVEKRHFLNTPELQWAPLGNHINSIIEKVPLSSKHPARIQDFFWRSDTENLLVYIKKNIPTGETLHLSNGALVCYITLKTGYKTDWGMFWENVPECAIMKVRANRDHGYFIYQNERHEVNSLFYGRKDLFENFQGRAIKIGRFYILHAP